MPDDIYSQDEELEIAFVLRMKKKEDLLSIGKSKKEAVERADKAYSKARREHAIEFLKKLDKKIEELSNRDVANLLQALLAMGLNIEDEEELEYWINLLEQIAVQRLNEYLNFSEVSEQHDFLSRLPLHRKKFLNKSSPFTLKEVESLNSISKSLEVIIQRELIKNKNSKQYEKLLEREKHIKEVQRVIKKDLLNKKMQEDKERLHKQNNNKRRSNRSKEKESPQEDYLDALKNKMIGANVEVNSNYWNQVLGAYEGSMDKAGFVSGWTVDSDYMKKESQSEMSKEDISKIEELRGLDKSYLKPEYTEGKEAEKDKSAQNNDGKENSATNQQNVAQATAAKASVGR